MEMTLKLSAEESADLGEAVGYLKFFEEEAEKGQLLNWIETNGLTAYLEKFAIAYGAFAKHAPYMDLLIKTMKEQGLLD